MIDISGKWALVTGASRGIGKEISIGLGKLGCNLVLHSRSIEHTKLLADDIALRNTVRVISVSADLSKPEQVADLVTEIKSAAPQIDIIYNNAGLMMPYNNDVWHIPGDDFRTSFEINVISQVHICNAFIPSMIERRWGRVINLCSGIRDQPQLAPYAVSKAAISKFTLDLAPTLEDSGVAINLLDPGWLRTDMGGPDAPNTVASVIPGALVPALINCCVSGYEFSAQVYAGMVIEQAVKKAERTFCD
ncbi:MAG: SDR family oxidoreductase [Gammaproteobacteria bacterium]